MATATLTSKGQITIPRQVRRDLGVSVGDRIDFIRLDDDAYAIVPASHSVRELKGVIRRPASPVSLDEMAAAIEAGARGG